MRSWNYFAFAQMIALKPQAAGNWHVEPDLRLRGRPMAPGAPGLGAGPPQLRAYPEFQYLRRRLAEERA